MPLYKIYQQKLTDLNSCDFGDLILHTVKILENYSDIREIYSNNFKYILVDEYQDISRGRYRFLKAIIDQQPDCRIMCVGDDWQSIYRFAGGEIGIMVFDNEFEKSEIIFSSFVLTKIV